MDGDGLHYLRAAGCALVLDRTGPRLPRVLHWAADLGELSAADLAALARLPWWAAGVDLPGHVLAEIGLQAPTLHPERVVLIEVTRS